MDLFLMFFAGFLMGTVSGVAYGYIRRKIIVRKVGQVSKVFKNKK